MHSIAIGFWTDWGSLLEPIRSLSVAGRVRKFEMPALRERSRTRCVQFDELDAGCKPAPWLVYQWSWG